jgi:hypothetical protein
MKRVSFAAAPAWAGLGFAALAIACLLCPPWAQAADNDVVAAEEDWELVLKEPDVPTVAPQVTCAMSPFGDLNDTYFTFEINHLSAPSFSPGGLHIHAWNGPWRTATFSRNDRSVMTTNNEVVTWTQKLEAGNGKLRFEIEDGVSSTWGAFGYSGMLAVEKGWGVNNINSYSPGASVSTSGVGFASNRVASLKIKCIRLKLANGQTLTDNTERVVFEQE